MDAWELNLERVRSPWLILNLGNIRKRAGSVMLRFKPPKAHWTGRWIGRTAFVSNQTAVVQSATSHITY
jgi:hypothetical protein